jgi:hypothetical protein
MSIPGFAAESSLGPAMGMYMGKSLHFWTNSGFITRIASMVLQERRLVEEARSKTARRRRGRQPPNSERELEAGAGQVRVTHSGVTATPTKQETEIEELNEVAPFPVDIDP